MHVGGLFVSAPQFREGDVVRCIPQVVAGVSTGEPFEAVVAVCGGGLEVIVRSHGGHARWGTRALVLLRRPVRVGDRVTWGYRALNAPVVDVTPDGVFVDYRAAAHSERWFVSWAGHDAEGSNAGTLIHADGTPIEPPPKLDAKAPGAHKVTDFETGTIKAEAEHGLGSFAAIVDKVHPADAPKTDAFYSIWGSPGAMCQLRDMVGNLAHERDELLVENAKLRRRVEQLEAVDKAERTAKGFAPPRMLRVRGPR